VVEVSAIPERRPMKRFLVGALVGIAFAVLAVGCETSIGVLTGNTGSQPMRPPDHEDREDQEKMQEMLSPDPNHPMTE